ncbi:PAS domain-containing protein [Streptomyces sp. NPDC001795]|uniref:PAS domain-containing protein n=1 Tax=Streptomyces sp. NPDC001795 TaxID=3154525 RepID=UPI00332B0216
MDASNELLRRAEPSVLLYPDGAVRSLNEAMASALSRPAEQCVGRYIWELLPASQRSVAKRIVANANKQQLTMRVLELPRPGRVSLVTLIEARPTTAAGDEQLVWVHALNVHNDLGSLLIPFRESAKAAGLGLCVYLPQVQQLEWLGGAPAVGALFPEASMPLPWMVRHVHPDDRGILRQLLDSGTTGRPWTGLRFQTEHVTGTNWPARPGGSSWGMTARNRSSGRSATTPSKRRAERRCWPRWGPSGVVPTSSPSSPSPSSALPPSRSCGRSF